MAVELIRKQVELNDMTKKETIQMVKERDIIVPDGKPDMQRVLYLDGAINIDQMDVQQDRIVYKGQVDVTIMYVPENGSNEIYTMKGCIPLEDFIILDGVNSNQKVSIDYDLEHLYWNILNERKINVKAIIQVTVEATKPKDSTIVTGVKSEIPTQTQMKELEVIKPMRSGSENMIVKDDLTIMQGKSSVAEILKMNTAIKEEQIKRTADEMLYNGMVEVTTMYRGQDEAMPIEIVKHRMPFSGNIDLPKSDDEAYWDCNLSVTPSYVQVAPDYDGEDRIIEVECMVNAKYNTYDRIKENVVDDIYCPGKQVSMTNSQEDYMTLVGRGESKSAKKDIIPMDGAITNADNVFSVEIKPVIDEQEIQGDKLTIGGMLEVKIVYTNPEGMNHIETAVEMIPFSEQLTIPGMTDKSYVNASVMPKDVEVSAYNKGDVMLEYVLQYLADAYNNNTLNKIDEVTVSDLDKETMNNCPSITVYVVKKNDSLWSLAKRFNTTVQDIMEINDIESNALIYPGQKLIILKKTKF